MAATKKADETNEVKDENKVVNKVTDEINIAELIKQAVAEATKSAVSETSKKYEEIVSNQENKIKELEQKLEDNIPINNEITMPKRVKIMHMGVGSANFSKGRVNVDFKEPFEFRELRYEILEEMFDNFGEWFRNMEIVILDKKVREAFGLEYDFEQYGADKEKFEEILNSKTQDCLTQLDRLTPMVAMTFLKYFLDEHLNNNPIASMKFTDVTKFYESRYAIHEIQNTLSDMIRN